MTAAVMHAFELATAAILRGLVKENKLRLGLVN